MSFTQVGKELNNDALLFLQHEGMGHSEEKIDYTTVIAYVFKKYSLKCGLKELGGKGKTTVTEELSQIHTRDKFCPESAKLLTEEQKRDTLESQIFLKVKRYGRVKG